MLNPGQFNGILLAMPFLQQADESLKYDLRQRAYFGSIRAGHDVFV